MRIFIVLTLMALASGACQTRPARSPVDTFERIIGAALAGDSATLEALIDFPALAASVVRESECLARAVMDSAASIPPRPCAIVQRTAADSTVAQFTRALRLTMGASAPNAADVEGSTPSLLDGMEGVDYGVTTYDSDTAMIQRRLRDRPLDAVVTIRFLLVPRDSVDWRVVGVRDFGRAMLDRDRRREAHLRSSNASGMRGFEEALASELTVHRFETGWDKADIEWIVTLRNRGNRPVRLVRPFLWIPEPGALTSVRTIAIAETTLVLPGGAAVKWQRRYPMTASSFAEGVLLGSRDSIRVLSDSLYTTERAWAMYRDWLDFRKRGPAAATQGPVMRVAVPPNKRQLLAAAS